MELSFDNLLYSEPLGRPMGTIADSRKNPFPDEDALMKMPGFAEHYIIRYNSLGGYAYGEIPANARGKKVLAITKDKADEDIYHYKFFEEVTDDMVDKTWSCSQNNKFTTAHRQALISDVKQALKKRTFDE